MTQHVKKQTSDSCEVECTHPEVVERVTPLIHQVEGVETIFKALSDATRMKIIYALTQEDELCVCDVAAIIGTSTATASHHLRLLRTMGIAKNRKQGKLVYYSVKDHHITDLVKIAIEHHNE
ncbi:ArsR/SmtB family transcription factor [Chryseomicrobium aureum]|uniref:ArsR/SmtB family transcription factor n=1 Tax=Chryseomicrobium aureum TaxID=1441723 RepID=UPI00195A5123|nr:metalloregulator ArsR/SmtB family transcription factor [Chryseomicrobium aureum]MBM7705789.1 DNA-binding transcriptional ArsR family regulator [Chryseomicrobium aureum]